MCVYFIEIAPLGNGLFCMFCFNSNSSLKVFEIKAVLDDSSNNPKKTPQ